MRMKERQMEKKSPGRDYSFLFNCDNGRQHQRDKIPQGIQNISVIENNAFINPYFYFLYGEGTKTEKYNVQKSPDLLQGDRKTRSRRRNLYPK